ncbi:transaldolase [Helicobacter canadensis]|uniref:Transaldolase n=1 Tax=Helicobacter canadensis MIT 98-5491 TaxID=537970 RepID=C5ZXA8_9HELI|nr:transaldolase [Helicobacter canadensis]EES89776.1 transaldolase [Helicobacter canadensis MIT 98-5491]EFR48572.1 transaldolase [Helicobacter canadensis MIT 98-5491]STO99815.1 transaldolase [Helicobacter canadensis]
MQNNISFSLWCDFIEREFLENDFTKMIEGGIIEGATSNPAIFQKSFLEESYREQKESLKGKNPKEIYEALAKSDIQRAAELLMPIYTNNPNDGYVSIEVDPNLCQDSKGTIEEGVRLFKEIGYPNVMIKIPATKAGFVAMEELISQGISVNATLVFTKEQTIECMEAFNRGYENLKKTTKKESKDFPRAVVSIFVSRFDRKCDSILKENGIPVATLGVKNAQHLYHIINDYSLPCVRALFASTGVKDDSLDPIYYIKELYHQYAINTAPLATIEAFMKVEALQETYLPSYEELDEYFKVVANAGVDLQKVSSELLEQGLEDFKNAFAKILESLA